MDEAESLSFAPVVVQRSLYAFEDFLFTDLVSPPNVIVFFWPLGAGASEI